ncbi:hypothetical protein ACP4OV_008767 [Aristida adscensionis]
MEKNPGAAPTSPEEEKVAEDLEEAAEREEVALKKGPWTTAEDAMLIEHVRQHGEGNWNAVQRMTGLLRCGKSCRLRWTNHLRPNLKKGSFSPDEELLIAQLHAQLGNKWARMAAHLPGRTDNEIKNYWNTRTKRRQRAGMPMYPPEVQLQLTLSKRCRYDMICSPLASPQQSGTSVHVLGGGGGDSTATAGYVSARPPPLDLAGQLAFTNHQTVQFLSPAPFSAPSSPWVKPFARNAHYFQFAHSSPVSPSTPTGALHPVTPDLSLGYGVRSGGDRSGLPPPSLSPGPPVELPSNQLTHANAMAPASAACLGGMAGGGLQDQPNTAASLEKMLQELHDAIKVEPSELALANGGAQRHGGAVLERHGGSGGNKSDGQLKDDMDTLFDLMAPTFGAPEHATPPARPNHSSSISQHSSEDQDPPQVDLGVELQVGGASSSDQDWGLDGGVSQWSSLSRIC